MTVRRLSTRWRLEGHSGLPHMSLTPRLVRFSYMTGKEHSGQAFYTGLPGTLKVHEG